MFVLEESVATLGLSCEGVWIRFVPWNVEQVRSFALLQCNFFVVRSFFFCLKPKWFWVRFVFVVTLTLVRISLDESCALFWMTSFIEFKMRSKGMARKFNTGELSYRTFSLFFFFFSTVCWKLMLPCTRFVYHSVTCCHIFLCQFHKRSTTTKWRKLSEAGKII